MRREKVLFDKGWKFRLGDILPEGEYWGFEKSGSHNQTGAKRLLEDSGWRNVNLPHDYVMEGTPVPSQDRWAPDNVIPLMESVGNLHTTRGSREGRIAWYRKHFPAMDTEGKRVYLRFDGIYRDSEIYVNEFFVGRHLSGYTGVTYDITDFLYGEKENLVAVRVDARKAEGWFYEGGGIYRHAWLVSTPVVAVDTHGIFVRSKVDLAKKRAEIMVQTTIRNSGQSSAEVEVKQSVTDPEGKPCADGGACAKGGLRVAVAAGATVTVEQKLEVEDVLLWDIDTPKLYSLSTALSSGDTVDTSFGIREIRFDKQKGFFLNGRNVKLKGVCCHQDHAGLGTALPDGIQEYRIRKLKEMGCNAYRSAHNPATEELLQVCDRLGMLVMNENRLLSSSSEDMAQLEELVLSARNHPCIFLWSLGNEEGKIHFTDQGRKIAATMRTLVNRLDGTRPTTVAVCMWDADSNYRGIDNPEVTGILTRSIDVFGFNYFTELWDRFCERYPGIPYVSTEHTSIPCTRGCRKTENEKCHLSMTDPRAMSHGEGEAAWKAVRDRDHVSGIFLWTGFDYHGEPSPYGWPAVSSQFGIFDLCGYPKDCFYYYQACWTDQPVLHLCGDGKVLWCITNCDEVELFCDRKAAGRYSIEKDSILILNDLGSGSVTAVGYRKGTEAARAKLLAYGAPWQLSVEAEAVFPEKDGTKTLVLSVSVLDRGGNLAENADPLVTLTYPKNFVLLGTGNGNPSSHENVKLNYRRAFNGRMQAIFSVTGSGTVTTQAPGLVSGSAEL